MPIEGSTLMRRQLGSELQALRGQVTMAAAAKALDCSPSKISHIENGRYKVGRSDLVVLLALYGASDRLDDLDELRKMGAAPSWWASYKLPSWLGDLVGLEQSAIRERVAALEIIPALLQTADYARAMHELGPGRHSASEIQRRVALRVERRKRIIGADPLDLFVVISEAALLRVAADPSIGPGQLTSLAADCQLPNVSVRVLPLSAGLHSAAGYFTLLDFPPSVPFRIGYEETASGGRLVEEEDGVQKLSALHDRLCDGALGETETLSLITQLSHR